MNSLISFCSLLAVLPMLPASSSKTKEIDWETEITRTNIRQGIHYGAHQLDELVRDSNVEDFVFIPPDVESVIQGDFEEMKQYLERNIKMGYWEDGNPNVVTTCHNTALVWATLIFTDGRNLTQEGYETVLYEYDEKKAKNKLIQTTV